jgi:hypothetical protein
MRIRSPLTAAILACVLVVFLETVVAPDAAQAQVPTPAPAPPPAQEPAPVPPPSPAQKPQGAPPAAKPPKLDPEIRLDAIVARVSALQAGFGLTMVAGTYVRSGIVGGLGFSRDGLSGRVDGLARFHLDPFRQSRWAPYGGAGISGRFDRVSGARAYLLVVAGLDGPIRNGMTPSVELGLGGGARLGVILRRATGERR